MTAGQSTNRSIKLTLAIMLLIVVLIFGLVIARQTFLAQSEQPTPAPELSHINTYVYEEPRPLPEFQLVDEKGEVFTQEDLKGQWTFAFVGFTNCPDICPPAMANLRKTESLLPETLPQPRYLFVTADPERDTAEKLDQYVSFFGEHFHAATGDLEVLRTLARGLGAAFSQREVDGEVLVSHSGHFSLINPDGKLAAVIQPPHSPEDIKDAFRQIYEWARENHARASRS